MPALAWSLAVTLAITNSHWRFGRATVRRWSAELWCFVRSSFFGRDASLPVAKTFDALAFTHILHVNMPSSCANHGNVVNQSALIIRSATFRFFRWSLLEKASFRIMVVWKRAKTSKIVNKMTRCLPRVFIRWRSPGGSTLGYATRNDIVDDFIVDD